MHAAITRKIRQKHGGVVQWRCAVVGAIIIMGRCLRHCDEENWRLEKGKQCKLV